MIVGTAGHIDHGKTALVGALTGVDTDRLKEEKARGISIDLGFAYLPAPDGSVIGFVDVPGHERFVRNMLAGATGIDVVLLVVAADDGIMPQTREHLAIVDLLGITKGIVALTKADLADGPRRSERLAEIMRTLASTGLAEAEILPVSSMTGEGIDVLRDKLFGFAGSHVAEAADGRFRLGVDRSFTLKGAGTVVTGTVLSGRVAVGDRVTVSPSGLSARIRSIHAQNREAAHGVAGQRCALNLTGDGITKASVARGDVVLEPALHAPAKRIDVRVRVLESEAKPLEQWTPVHLHHAAAEVSARVVLLSDLPIAPGAESFAQLVLDAPIAAAAGDRFVLRDTTAQRTIAGGTLLDLRAPTRKRRSEERLTQLAAHRITDPSRALSALLGHAPFHLDLTAFARDRGLTDAATAGLVEGMSLVTLQTPAGTTALSTATGVRLKRALMATLALFHGANPDLPGIGIERLRLQLEPRLPALAFVALLQGLARAREVSLDGSWVRLPSHEVRLTDADAALWAVIRPLISGGERFRPPRVRDMAGLVGVPEAQIRRLMKLLGRLGKADEVAHDHFFMRGTVAEMVGIAAELSAAGEGGQFAAAQFRDRIESGRKVAIQILEFFDRHGVTLRRGDLRRMNRHRLDLFQAQEPADEPEATLKRATQASFERSRVLKPGRALRQGTAP